MGQSKTCHVCLLNYGVGDGWLVVSDVVSKALIESLSDDNLDIYVKTYCGFLPVKLAEFKKCSVLPEKLTVVICKNTITIVRQLDLLRLCSIQFTEKEFKEFLFQNIGTTLLY